MTVECVYCFEGAQASLRRSMGELRAERKASKRSRLNERDVPSAPASRLRRAIGHLAKIVAWRRVVEIRVESTRNLKNFEEEGSHKIRVILQQVVDIENAEEIENASEHNIVQLFV